MMQENDDLLTLLRCHDVDPDTAGRIRTEARARFRRVPSVISRVYNRILEPALVFGTVVSSLAWALDRVNFLTR